ncbi:unnamed protein product [Medioppia subpectinata]|uniref:Chitin-binding type-4 domain-containing protein n=1 Tax=Medioppia subpectinata TaxID=1979941 RepID=A0A7R9L590_9ACAR|nr:unnamed protein product [Medioppia subpectinata]CAG2115632.1 unnamed protein product [Medioppia subpectinata]
MLFIIFLSAFITRSTVCHDSSALLDEPPSRSSAYRFFFQTLPNDRDGYLNCGGFDTQWRVNGGKCGVCGDPYNGARDNELPYGKYTKDLMVTRTYKSGTTIYAKVHMIKNNGGHFEFRLCPATALLNNATIRQEPHNWVQEVTDQCLDSHRLEVLGSTDGNRWCWPIPDRQQQGVIYQIKVKLPQGLRCERCVFQWTWVTADNYGWCSDGSWKLGCGPQTTHKACADVQII